MDTIHDNLDLSFVLKKRTIPIVVVKNDKTDYEGTFTHITPQEAVVCAYEQEENNNYITWEYNYHNRVTWKDFKLFCGHYYVEYNVEGQKNEKEQM